MSDLPLDPPEEQEQETLFGTILLRLIVMVLCAFLGFALVLVGYAIALFLDFDIHEFSSLTSAYFIISILIWVIISLITPFASISRIFEEIKGVTFVRVAIFIIAFAVFVLLYWYLITFIVSLIL